MMLFVLTKFSIKNKKSLGEVYSSSAHNPTGGLVSVFEDNLAMILQVIFGRSERST